MPPNVLNVGVPTSPFLDPGTRDISTAWRAFLTSLYHRTGGGVGVDVANLQAEIDHEEQVRADADLALTTAISNEAAIRQAADSAETEARREGDAGLQTAINAEATARQRADNALVPRAQLCSMWANCDLSFLPTSDPGHGLPWLSGGVMMVGAGPADIRILLESEAAFWNLESSGGEWLYG